MSYYRTHFPADATYTARLRKAAASDEFWFSFFLLGVGLDLAVGGTGGALCLYIFLWLAWVARRWSDDGTNGKGEA